MSTPSSHIHICPSRHSRDTHPLFIDDQLEMLKNLPPNVGVLLFRNGGRFDFEDK